MSDDAVEIREAVEDDLSRLRPMWLSLYEHQRKNGMLIELPVDAFQHWSNSLIPVLGRFGCLFVAEDNGELVGFLAGRIRSLPQYFGGDQVGFISEVFVQDSHRSHGIGRRLVAKAVSWFNDQNITRLELQVITRNEGARRLYRQLGWVEELVQMVWLPMSREVKG